jgi:hypothetical protein
VTVTILCIVGVFVGALLCLVFFDPWQRPRYERLAHEAEKRTRTAVARLNEIDEFDATAAAELHREANGQ